MALFYPRRAILALPLSLAFSRIALADLTSHAAWRKRVVPVVDMTTDMGDYVAQKVEQYNAALAGTRLRLSYQRGRANLNCHKVGIKTGQIRVCNTATVRCDGPAAGCMIWKTEPLKRPRGQIRHRILGARVVLGASAYSGPHDEYGWPYGCHEIGHALGLNHGYGNPNSCMNIDRDAPGPADIAALRAMYGKRKKQRR